MAHTATTQADFDAAFAALVAGTTHRIRCGSCHLTHITPQEVRACYIDAEIAHDEYLAEAAADRAADVAFARSREAISESGTWFGYGD